MRTCRDISGLRMSFMGRYKGVYRVEGDNARSNGQLNRKSGYIVAISWKIPSR